MNINQTFGQVWKHTECLQKVKIHKKNLVDLDRVFYDYTVNREEKCGSNGFSNHLHIFQPCGFSVSQLQFLLPTEKNAKPILLEFQFKNHQNSSHINVKLWWQMKILQIVFRIL